MLYEKRNFLHGGSVLSYFKYLLTNCDVFCSINVQGC